MRHPVKRLQCHPVTQDPRRVQGASAPRATKYTKCERRVRPSDEEKDRGVLDDLKHTLGPAYR